MGSLTATSNTPKPRRVRHWQNAIWWIALIASILAVSELPNMLATPPPPPLAASPNSDSFENEAFLALVFGRISTTRELAIPAATFRAQLTALKQAGYSSVRLDQVQGWRSPNATALPGKPVLLTFDKPHRETLEIADGVLVAQGMTALVFVDVNELDDGNVQMASWHQLEQLVNSGRWEVGVSGCPTGGEESFLSSSMLAQKHIQQREELSQRLHVPVMSADCPHAWDSNYGDAATVWNESLAEASLPFGFVIAPIGANYRDDPGSSLKRIRVSRTWDQAQLLAHLGSQMPRRAAFVDTFQSSTLLPDWVIDSGQVTINDGTLNISNNNGEPGALVRLGGSDHWQDADVEVQLHGQPEGQFWVFLRHNADSPFVRLGIAHGQVLVQKSDANGITAQLASLEALPGPLTLRLRIAGSRLMAYLNGNPVLPRPVEVPPGLDDGAVALAVWNEPNDTATYTTGLASVRVNRVNAVPLSPRVGILLAGTEGDPWSNLRRHADELSIVSPRYFSWEAGKAGTTQARNAAVEIFAHHHRIKLLPAVLLAGDTLHADAPALTEQCLNWASEPSFHGLNVVVENHDKLEEWRSVFTQLDQHLRQSGKSLVITLLSETKLNTAEAALMSSDLQLVAAPSEQSPLPLTLLRTIKLEPTR